MNIFYLKSYVFTFKHYIYILTRFCETMRGLIKKERTLTFGMMVSGKMWRKLNLQSTQNH